MTLNATNSVLPIPDKNGWAALRKAESLAWERVLNTGSAEAWGWYSGKHQELQEAAWAIEASRDMPWRCWLMAPRGDRISAGLAP